LTEGASPHLKLTIDVEYALVEPIARGVRAAWFAAALIVVLAGCTSSAPNPVATPSVLAGTWVADGPGSSQGAIELNSDGSMTAEGIPTQVVLGPAGDHSLDPIDWSEVVNLAGRWWVQENGDSPYLTFTLTEPVNKRPGFLRQIRKEGDKWVVYYEIGDPDAGENLDFHREAG
jgi:hypothetical protein